MSNVRPLRTYDSRSRARCLATKANSNSITGSCFSANLTECKPYLISFTSGISVAI